MWDTQWASNTPKVERETAEKFHPEKGLEVAKAHVNNCPMKIISWGRRKAKAGNKCDYQKYLRRDQKINLGSGEFRKSRNIRVIDFTYPPTQWRDWE